METTRAKLILLWHITSSIATVLFGICIAIICFFPNVSPLLHNIFLNPPLSSFIPYILYVMIGSSLFSIWYFWFRKSDY